MEGEQGLGRPALGRGIARAVAVLAGAVWVVQVAGAQGTATAAAQPGAATAGPAVATAAWGTAGGPAPGAGLVLSGSLQALQQATVSAQTEGQVRLLAVKAGDRVRRGQLLLRLDERQSDAAVRAAQAAVDQADAGARTAQQHLQRTRELRGQGFVSAAALEQADQQARAAAAALEQARAARAQAQLARGHADVLAPFDGVVAATLVDSGDLAQPGRGLVTVFQPGRLRAVVPVPQSRVLQARAARRTDVLLADGRALVPVQRTEMPSTDPVSQTVEWRLDLAPADAQALAPGQAVQVRFEGAPAATPSGPAAAGGSVGAATGAAAAAGGPAPAVVASRWLPAAAVVQRGELSAVYAVQDGRFVLRPVRLGSGAAAPAGTAPSGLVEIVAGLRPGERVALDGVRAGLSGARPAP